MSQLHGKQLRDGTTSLGKLSGSGIVEFNNASMSFNAGAVLRTETSNIQVANDVVNKEYVDAVAAGLDPKESSRVIFDDDITLISGYTYSNGNDGVGATLTFNSGSFSTIDGIALNDGDRVIINSETDQFVNGIYVYGTTNSFFTRATDFDGSPAKEIDGGEFSFVTEGTTYADTGWVVSIPDGEIQVGTNSIVFVQFSSAGVITTGDGLSQTGNQFNVVAGTGIGVDTTVYIESTGVTANSYGSAGSVATFTVNTQGQLTTAESVTIDIASTQINDFSIAVENVVFTASNFVDSDTVDFIVTTGDFVTADVKLSGGTSSALGVTANGIFVLYDNNTIILNNDGQLVVNSSAVVPDVSNGLSIDGGDIVLGGTLSQSTTISGDGGSYSLNLLNLEELVITASSSFDVNVDNGLIMLDAGESGTVELYGGDITLYAAGSVDIIATQDVNIDTVDFNLDFSGSGTVSVGGSQKGLVYSATPSNSLPLTLIHKQYVDDLVQGINGDFITAIEVGAGLTVSSGTEGTASISILDTTAGIGLTFTNGVYDVNLGVNSGLTFSGDDIIIDTNIAGSGLDFTNGVLNVGAGAGITVSSNDVAINLATNSGLNTTSGLSIDPSIAGTGLTFSAGVLSVEAGSAQPVYATFSGITATAGGSIGTLPSTPNDYSRVEVYVNGLKVTSGGNVGNLPTYSNQSVQFNGTASTWQSTSYSIEATDLIEIVYES